jgi:hypothetical protein
MAEMIWQQSREPILPEPKGAANNLMRRPSPRFGNRLRVGELAPALEGEAMVNWLRKLFDKLQVHFDGDILLQNLRYAFRTLRPGMGFLPASW